MVGLSGRRGIANRRTISEREPSTARTKENNSSANSVDSTSTASSTTGLKKRGGVVRKSVRAVETPPPRSSMTTRRQTRNARGAVSERIQRNQSLRTSLFKSYRPLPAPRKTATWRPAESANEGGYTYRRGDIISLIDEQDNKPYFGQISTILVDPYGQGHAVLVYLIPLKSAFDPHDFDAEHFVHGVAEFDPVDLRECGFVQRCPDKDTYLKIWTPKRCFEEQMRRELSDRIQDLRSVCLAELTSCDTSRYYTDGPEPIIRPKQEDDDLTASTSS